MYYNRKTMKLGILKKGFKVIIKNDNTFVKYLENPTHRLIFIGLGEDVMIRDNYPYCPY